MIFQVWTNNNCDCCGNWRLGLVVLPNIKEDDQEQTAKQLALSIAESRWKNFSVEIKPFNMDEDEWLLLTSEIAGELCHI